MERIKRAFAERGLGWFDALMIFIGTWGILAGHYGWGDNYGRFTSDIETWGGAIILLIQIWHLGNVVRDKGRNKKPWKTTKLRYILLGMLTWGLYAVSATILWSLDAMKGGETLCTAFAAAALVLILFWMMRGQYVEQRKN